MKYEQKKELQHKISVMQAALDGKQIQVKVKDSITTWRDWCVEDLIWNFYDCEYRVVEQPIERWLCTSQIGRGADIKHAGYTTKEEAVAYKNRNKSNWLVYKIVIYPPEE